jgi:prepilin-type processing-associated H-X9-DG protein
LPYLSRNDLYAAVQAPAQGTTKTPFFDASGNMTGLSRPPLNNTLLCPGDFDRLELGFPDNPTSFVCNAGREDAQATAQFPADWRTNAVFMNRDDANGRRVEITDTSSIRSGDGLATTIMLSENLDALHWHNPDTRNWYLETYSGIIFWPPNANGLPPNDVHRINGPKVNVTTPYDTARPSSTHPGGVNMVFTDGHGQFVRQDIDYTVYCALMTPKGANAMNPGTTNASNNQIRNQPKLTPGSF